MAQVSNPEVLANTTIQPLYTEIAMFNNELNFPTTGKASIESYLYAPRCRSNKN